MIENFDEWILSENARKLRPNFNEWIFKCEKSVKRIIFTNAECRSIGSPLLLPPSLHIPPQFEREVIGERVRDKIAASKRKGIWVGGPVPLGYRSVGKKLEIVPEDAALVRKIYEDYLRLGSIGELAAALEGEGVRPPPRVLKNGTTIAAERFMVGALAHILKNRFYIGEVAYRGEIHKGEHAPILDRDLFDAVQEKLAERAVARRLARSSSPSMLAGLIFDERGNPMSPSHANKKGVRYRYYVSQALLQNRKAEAGAIARVSAPDVEALVAEAVTKALRNNQEMAQASDFVPDRDLISRRVERVIVHPTELEVILRSVEADTGPPMRLRIAFAPNLPRRKGIAHAPAEPTSVNPATRESLLRAIARTRGWVDAILAGRIASFDDIAAAESLAERHVRRLAPLAFLSPTIIATIADGEAPAGLTVSRLTQALPHAWTAQEQMLGMR